MTALRHLKLSQKIAALVVLLALPAAALGFLYSSVQQRVVAQANRELAGARMAEAVGHVLAEVVNHRGRIYALLSGDEGRRPKVVQSEEKVESLLAKVRHLNGGAGGELEPGSEWPVIEAAWKSVRLHAGAKTAEQSAQHHDALIAHLQKFLIQLATHSQLTVEPNADTAALIRFVLDDSPKALLAANRLRMQAFRTAMQGTLHAYDLASLKIWSVQLHEILDTGAENLAAASEQSRVRIGPAFATVQSTGETFAEAVRKQILEAAPITASGKEIYESGSANFHAIVNLSALVFAAINDELHERVKAATLKRNIAVTATFAALLLALALSLLITRSMTRPMNRVIEVFDAISGGHYDNTIDRTGGDEAAQVLRALDAMQGKLKAQIETERRAAAVNARIKQALDSVSSNVLVTDDKLEVVYVNKAAERLFKTHERDFRADLPRLNAGRLVGSSVDMLFRDAQGQRSVLENLTRTHTSDERLGSRSLRIAKSPVADDAGMRIGVVMEWFDRTQEVNAEEEVASVVRGALEGNLASRIRLQDKSGFFESLGRGLNQLIENVAAIIAQVKTAANDVHRGAEEISRGNENLSQRTAEQSSSLEETAASMEQMTATVKQNAENAGHANQLAAAARDRAEEGGGVTSNAMRAMAQINESAKRIADITAVIDEIAFQTNLLALNAAVEAARAGEQGRGFAIVASEVRSLAGRSAVAAKEIKDLIQDSLRKVEDGSTLVSRSGQMLDQIVLSVKKVSDIVAAIAVASREQSSGIEQVNKAVMQMDELTQQNASLVEQASAASQSMAEQARSLNQLMSHYRVSESQEAQFQPVAEPVGRAIPSSVTRVRKAV